MEKHFNLFQFINLVRTTIFHYNSTLISYVIKKKKIKTTRIHLISDALHLINIDRVWRNAFQSAKCATGVLEMSFFPHVRSSRTKIRNLSSLKTGLGRENHPSPPEWPQIKLNSHNNHTRSMHFTRCVINYT